MSRHDIDKGGVMGSLTSATTREFRKTGMVAVLVGIVYAALPGAPEGCWLAVRLVPAVPLVVVGLIIVALGAQTYLLDRQADEVDALRARIASAHATPAVALAGEAARAAGGGRSCHCSGSSWVHWQSRPPCAAGPTARRRHRPREQRSVSRSAPWS
jgi:hypothetical protein